MSFSLDVKQELSKISNLSNKEAIRIELLGYLMTNNIKINGNRLRFATESEYNINRFGKLLSNLDNNSYKIGITGNKYNILINKQEIEKTLNLTDIYDVLNLNLSQYLKDELLEKAFFRGIFLGGGSINNPEKIYHLEMILKKIKDINYLTDTLRKYEIDFKTLEKNNKYIIYTKDGEKISNFMALIGASSSVLRFEEIRVYRDMKNKVNRQVNCETANLNKIANTAAKHINAINYLKEKGKFNSLPEQLKEMANIRIRNPEASLIELGMMLKEPIGKSGVNHRLKKIEEIVEELKKCEM